MMEHIVSLSEKHGITDIVSTFFINRRSITSYFGRRQRLRSFRCNTEKLKPIYGTAGSVRNAADFLNERFYRHQR